MESVVFQKRHFSMSSANMYAKEKHAGSTTVRLSFTCPIGYGISRSGKLSKGLDFGVYLHFSGVLKSRLNSVRFVLSY